MVPLSFTSPMVSRYCFHKLRYMLRDIFVLNTLNTFKTAFIDYDLGTLREQTHGNNKEHSLAIWQIALCLISVHEICGEGVI